MTFRMLTEGDLKEIGVPFGPRKRIIHLLGEEKRLEKSAPFDAVVGVPVGERRQLTVMFCDMVGFTKLAYKLDPERLQVVIRAYEDACTTCVNRYEGYVFTTLGDGIVAFFGFPLAHEGEAERAIRAGLDIIETISGIHIPGAGKLQVRIGIAAGMVVVTSGERNAVGETMNLASRLQSDRPSGHRLSSASGCSVWPPAASNSRTWAKRTSRASPASPGSITCSASARRRAVSKRRRSMA